MKDPYGLSKASIPISYAHLLLEIMVEKGLYPEFSSAVMTEVNQIEALDFTTATSNKAVLDLTQLPWCSIDNDDSLDLDQLTASEILADGRCKIYVAIADVDVYVKKNSVIDLHARHNSTSVYSSIKIFPMLFGNTPTLPSHDPFEKMPFPSHQC